jgi:hypothetical protein
MPDTSSGKKYEEVISKILSLKKDYSWKDQVLIGTQPDGRGHKIDFVGEHQTSKEKILVSCKVQEGSGTTFEKLTYEVLKLIDALNKNQEYKKAYILLDGQQFNKGTTAQHVAWVKQGLKVFIPSNDLTKVRVMSASEFINLAVI